MAKTDQTRKTERPKGQASSNQEGVIHALRLGRFVASWGLAPLDKTSSWPLLMLILPVAG